MASRLTARAVVRARGALGVAASRPFSDKATEVPPPVSDAFKKAAPNLQLPKFPSQFMKPRPDVPSSLPSKLTVNFVLPFKIELDAKEVRSCCFLRDGSRYEHSSPVASDWPFVKAECLCSRGDPVRDLVVVLYLIRKHINGR